MNEAFWESVCGVYPQFRALAIVDVVILALLVFSFPFLTVGSGPFVVATLTTAVVVVSLGLFAVVHRGCKSRRREE